jgi:hypothetical protein
MMGIQLKSAAIARQGILRSLRELQAPGQVEVERSAIRPQVHGAGERLGAFGEATALAKADAQRGPRLRVERVRLHDFGQQPTGFRGVPTAKRVDSSLSGTLLRLHLQ